MGVLTKLRLKLLDHGYTPLANHDKRCFLQHWQDIVVTAEMIRKWARNRYEATGLRLENGLVMLDVDAGLPALVDRLAGEAERILPGLFNQGLVRFSAGGREAWFCRVEGPGFTRLASRLWMQAGEDPDGKGPTQRLEVFGGSRQAGAFGPHRIDEQGTVVSEYSWDKLSPADVPLADLPAYTLEQFGQLCDAFDRIAEEMGLVAVAPARHADDATVLYVLEPDTVIELMDGTNATVAELETYAPELRSGEYLRCSGLFHSPDRVRRDSHTIAMGRHGIGIFDFQDGVTYCRRDAEPPAAMAISAETISALAAMQARAQPEPDDDEAARPPDEPEPASDATPEAVLEFLLRNYAVDRLVGKAVVDLRAADLDKAYVDMAAFQNYYAEFRFFTPPKRSGPGTFTPVVKAFMTDARRIKVEGVRFRPGAAFPVFAGPDGLYKNVYRQPRHAGDADLAPLLEGFLPVFVPDAVQREWFLDVIAHRWMHPGVPGPSLLYVAHGADDPMQPDYGTGRSVWFDFEAELFSPAYVRNEDFRIVSGQSSQADYTSWKAGTRLVTIDEAQTTVESGGYRGGVAGYEMLKTLADPNPRRRTFRVKYGPSFEDFDYAPLDIATNHQGATFMAAGDRRFGVIECGRPLTMPEAAAIHAFIKRPGAAAAFARWCEARDLRKFNPYAPPPVFSGKARMQQLSTSEMDEVFGEMRKKFSLLFTKSQARQFAMNNIETTPQHGDRDFERRFEAAFRQYCTILRGDGEDRRVQLPVAVPASLAGLGKQETKRERVATFSARRAAELTGWSHEFILAEVHKNSRRASRNYTFDVVDGGLSEDSPK